MNSRLTKNTRNLGLAYLAVWCNMILSAIVIFAFWYDESEPNFYKYSCWTLVVTGFAAAIYGILAASNLNKALQEEGRRRSKLLPWAFAIPIICNILGWSSLFGLNLTFPVLFQMTNHSHNLSMSSIFQDFSILLFFLSVIAMFLFWLFPLFTTIGLKKMSKTITMLKVSYQASLTMTIIGFIFGPLLLSMVNAGFLTEEHKAPTGLNIFYAILYGCLLLWFLIPFFLRNLKIKDKENKEDF